MAAAVAASSNHPADYSHLSGDALLDAVEKCKKSWMAQGPEIWRTFPDKVVELNKLHQQAKKAAYVAPTDLETLNNGVFDLAQTLKGYVSKMVDELDALRLWVTLSMPKFEDGNTFGMEVQEQIIQILAGGKASGAELLESIQEYLIARGQLVAQVTKYPNLKDLRRSLDAYDERQRVAFVNTCADLRNNYAILFDLIQKNIAHIVNPKGAAHSDDAGPVGLL